MEVVQGAGLAGLAARLAGQVDLLVSNPPYVATEEEEAAGAAGLAAAWAGGRRGLGLTNHLLDSLPSLLSSAGLAYIVLEQCNSPDQVVASVRQQGLHCQVVKERRAGREFLKVIKISKLPFSKSAL